MADQVTNQNGTQIALNGGVYPVEDGTWRFAVWFSGMKTEAEANQLSAWMNKLLSANVNQNPPPQQQAASQQPPQAAHQNGSAESAPKQ